MMNTGRCMYILFLSCVLFLFGCSGGKKQTPSQETVINQAVQEAATESAEPIVQAEPAAEQVKPQEQPEPEAVATPEAASEPAAQPAPDQSQESVQIPEAEQKLTFARNNLKMAQKGILGYSQIVAICRGILSDYPDTPYVQQAQELLRQVPQNQRSQFNLTDEELGTE